MKRAGYLADRPLGSITKQANLHDLRFAKVRAPEVPWPLPTMDLLEALDCVRLAKWEGPVNRAPFVPALGATVPGLGMAA